MLRGFWGGLLWGVIVCLITVAIASLVADGPDVPSVSYVTPNSANAIQSATTAPVQQQSKDPTLARDSQAPDLAAPVPDAAPSTAIGSLTALVPPQIGTVSALTTPAAVTEVLGSFISQADDLPRRRFVALTQLSITDIDALASDVRPVAAAPVADVPAPELARADAPLPETDVAVTATPATLLAPEREAVVVAEAQTATQPTPSAPQVAPIPLQETTVPSPARPSVGRPARVLIAPQPDAQTVVSEEDPTADPRPLVRNAVDFSPSGDRPLMAVVLIDDGGPLDQTFRDLESFPFPLTFALPVTAKDAKLRLAAYAAAGFEVLPMLDLPRGARPADVEVTLAAAMDAFPMAPAFLEGTDTGVQENRSTATQVSEILQTHGYGMVFQTVGLNAGPRVAEAIGLPSKTVFRDIDSADQPASTRQRFLNQAAFRAGQSGGVVLMGRLSPDTRAALLDWGMSTSANRVAMAPISALLRAGEAR